MACWTLGRKSLSNNLHDNKFPRTRVAVLVHNEVFKDARVRKEAATLVAAGYDVDIFGITKAWTDHPSKVEGAHVELLLNQGGSRRGKIKAYMQGLIPEAILVISCASLLGLAVSSADAPWMLRIVISLILSTVFLVGCLKRNSPQRRKRNSFVRHLLSGVAAVATVLLIHFNVFSPWDMAWVGFGVWGLLRLDPSPARLAKLYNKLRSLVAKSTRESRYNQLATLLADRVLAGEYDVVHCHDIIALVAGGRIKRQKPQTILIWDAHEIYEDMANAAPREKALVQSIIKKNQKLIDGFITINESIAKFYQQKYAFPPASVVMNATRFAGQVEYDGRLHRAAGLNNDQKILIFQGGLGPHRGITQLLEAAINLPYGWSIVMMGWGNMQKEVAQTIADLGEQFPAGRAPLCLIPPVPQEELAEWTAGATLGAIFYEDVGLNHLYCTPNKLWEYPNAGVPIVATALVEMAAMINAWGTGILLPRACEASDIIDLLHAVTDEKIAELKQKCAIFSREMDWSKYESKILQHYPPVDRRLPVRNRKVGISKDRDRTQSFSVLETPR